MRFNLIGWPWILGFALACFGCSTATVPTSAPPPSTATTSAAHDSVAPTSKPEETPVGTEKTPAETPGADGSATDAISIKEMDWLQLQEVVASHKGKVVVVDIWSTSCEPCLRELPYLVSMQKRHPGDVVCISFDCDYDGRKNRPVAYYRERVLSNLTKIQADKVVNVMCTVPADELFQQIDLDSIPAVCVYDRTGKLAKRFDNRTPASETEEGISYEKQIDPLVAELVKAEQN